MHGYRSTSYGDGFADVYDEWYADVTDVAATVEWVAGFAGAGARVLELGVGTGRLAVPLALAGLDVVGIDASAAMIARLRTRIDAERDHDGRPPTVTAVLGDMVADLPDGPFDAVLVAYNTLFNLLDDGEQQACFHAVAARLAPGGHFVVEAVVPDAEAPAGADVTVRSLCVDRVVLSVSDHRPGESRTNGQFVEFTEAGGVRLRPWSIRWSTPDELDAMAARAGLRLTTRTADMAGTVFDESSSQHVSVYLRPN